MTSDIRYRCPKNGKFVNEWDCMMCSNPPEIDNEDYMLCWSYNTIFDSKERRYVSRWNNKWKSKIRNVPNPFKEPQRAKEYLENMYKAVDKIDK